MIHFILQAHILDDILRRNNYLHGKYKYFIVLIMLKFIRTLLSHNVGFFSVVMSIITLIVLKHTLYNERTYWSKLKYRDEDYVDVSNDAGLTLFSLSEGMLEHCL